MRQPNLVSLYLHIPFCTYRCSYCDFNTYTTLGDVQSDYAAALAKEVEIVGRSGSSKKTINTIFFGGGTPSVMALPDLERILASVDQNFAWDSNREVTLEANPETIDLAYMQGLKSLGINRISFGAQSALAADLQVLGRAHNFQTVVEAVDLTRQAGIDNLSVDLIYGVPGQTVEAVEQTLDAVLPLNLSHMSLYCLTVEPGTALHREVNSGRVEHPDPDMAADQYDALSERLDGAGFDHYEISNWSKSNLDSQHNLAYWHNAEYLGLGAGAHGHAGGYRYHVIRQPRNYIKRMNDGAELDKPYPLTPAVADSHPIPEDEEIADTIIMGLRLLKEGLDTKKFAQRFGQSIHEIHGETVDELVDMELLTWEGDALFLTEKGQFISNQVFHRFI